MRDVICQSSWRAWAREVSCKRTQAEDLTIIPPNMKSNILTTALRQYMIELTFVYNLHPPCHVTLQPENDETPSMVTEQVFVQEGQTVVLSNASVYVTDLDTPASRLVFTLHIPPSHGEFYVTFN